MGRFINADAYTSTGQGLLGNNMFAYCNNNPVFRVDQDGNAYDYMIDWIFVLWSIKDTTEDPSLKNWACLALDILLAVVPFVPSGGSQIIKAGNQVLDLSKLADKVTVIGETMDRVREFADSIKAMDNLYEGFKLYTEWAQKGIVGKIFAEIVGKASNAAWLFNKLRQGYTVIDIGIDAERVARSSSYILEQVVSFAWNIRNVFKGLVHAVLRE